MHNLALSSFSPSGGVVSARAVLSPEPAPWALPQVPGPQRLAPQDHPPSRTRRPSPPRHTTARRSRRPLAHRRPHRNGGLMATFIVLALVFALAVAAWS